jgi:hypothetical protein
MGARHIITKYDDSEDAEGRSRLQTHKLDSHLRRSVIQTLKQESLDERCFLVEPGAV